MKSKLLFILIAVFALGINLHVNAENIVPVSLSIVSGPNDGPAQDGKEPVTPNQFAVTLNGRVLNVTTKLNGVVQIELVNQTVQNDVYSGQFVKSVACKLHSAGDYVLSLAYEGTKLSGNFKLTLTQDEAADIVLKKYEKLEDVEIYVSNKILAPKDTIHIVSEKIKGDYLIAPYETWVAYVNLMPSANWSHACQYVLIDALTGKAIVEDRDMFPIDQSEYMPYRTRDWMQNVKVKTQQDAFLIADSLYKKETVSIWVSNTYYMGNESIELPTGDKIKVPLPLSMYWVVFVDLYPMANWGHPCDYLFIDAYTKRITKVSKDIFPLNQTSLFTQLRWDNKQAAMGIIMPEVRSCDARRKIATSRDDTIYHSPQQGNQKWAAIISGGLNINNNFVRYWNDCSAMYQTLINNGFDPKHILVAISDGLDDNPDMICNNGMYANSPWDLDGNGTMDVNYPATRSGVFQMFSTLQDSITDEDELFVFTTDHGGHYENNSYLWLWDAEALYDDEFASLLDGLHVARINVLMEQCYSGGFIDDVEQSNLDSIVITTACSPEQQSWSTANGNYDMFVYWWCTAVNGISPDGINIGSADYNADGYISMQEAYFYACAHDYTAESPMQFSIGKCLKFSLTLTQLLNLCESPISVSGYDLYIKDNAADFGEAPNTTTNKQWLSTDIWFEEVNGGVVNTLQQGRTYKVCARVYNRGDQPSPGGELIYWHWTKALIGGSWPSCWFDDYQYTCNNTSIIRGAMMNPNGTALPPINGGDSYVVFDYWTVPYLDYSICSIFDENVDDLWHYCLLARIVDAQEQPGEDRTPYSLTSFVLGSNNVASRNFVILGNSNLSEAELPAAIVGIATPNMADGHYSIYCDVLTAPIETGSLFITLSPDMYSNWSMTGTGYVDVDQSGRLEIIASHAELTDFMIGGYDFYPIKIEVDTTSILMGELIFDIYLVDSNDSIVGGERFVYRRGLSNSIPDPNMMQSDLSLTNPVLVDSMISCSPNPAHTYIDVQVVDLASEIAICDIQGRCLIHSANTHVDVSSLSKGLYWIIVKTNNGYRQTKFIKQ